MRKVELAYLAGILDADGYFTIKRSTYHMRVRGDAGAAVVAKALLPFLRIKKRQAILLLELRASKDRPRSEIRERSQRTRWGTEMIFKKKVVSEAVLQERECLHTAIRELNDGRINQPVLI